MTDTSLNSRSINPASRPGAALPRALQAAIERIAAWWRGRASRQAALRLLEVAELYAADQPSIAEDLRAAAHARLCTASPLASDPPGAPFTRCRSSFDSGSAPCRNPACTNA